MLCTAAVLMPAGDALGFRAQLWTHRSRGGRVERKVCEDYGSGQKKAKLASLMGDDK